MTIRRAEAADVAAVEQIVEAAYAPYIPRLGVRPGPMRDDYAALVADGVVWVTGVPVAGLVVLLARDGYLLLDNIAVAPAAHGQGVGRALLRFAEARAQADGFAEIRLYTHQKMTENIALYARSGWQETGRGRQDGFDRVFFRKPVATA
jgi:ribosomal protein S18 acetylase RimI-like enzyme